MRRKTRRISRLRLGLALGALGIASFGRIGPVRLGIAPSRPGCSRSHACRRKIRSSFLTAGIAGVVSVEFVDSDGFSLALAVRPSIENARQLFGDSVGLYGGTALLDFRFRAAKTSPPKPPKRKRPRD